EQLALADSKRESETVARTKAPAFHRVSRDEFRITTAEPGAAPQMSIGSRQAAKEPVEEAAPAEGTKIAMADSPKVSQQFEVVFGKWLQK
ncbi:hypothetical protein, partial [Segeticoccus rhizosphaerae]|uniref:hypothetical protein n=1 Tax=Segeticoccus rhizosphaerae TaxID=1104777 RepID=UPI001396A519